MRKFVCIYDGEMDESSELGGSDTDVIEEMQNIKDDPKNKK
jgi:hypothetical protein